MEKDELTNWALANGWQMIEGHPSLTKPSPPHQAIVRLVLKATVGVPYAKIEADAETGFPRGLGLDTISGFSMLMQDNRNRAVFGPKPPR